MRAIYEFRLSMYGSCSRSSSRTGLLTHQGVTSQRQYVPENVAPNNLVAVGCAGVQQTLFAPGTGYYTQQHCSLTLFKSNAIAVALPQAVGWRSGEPSQNWAS